MTPLINNSTYGVFKKHPDSLVVVLKSRGNPDHHQNPREPVSPEAMRSCDTFREASELCRAYIGTYNIGGGNWTGGQIYHPVKGLIAHVSYNGRVWQSTTGEWEPDREEVDDIDSNDY